MFDDVVGNKREKISSGQIGTTLQNTTPQIEKLQEN